MSFETTTRTIAGRPIRNCSSCGAPIVWFKTEAGKWAPVDAGTVEAADMNLDITRHKSHFATCPNAPSHRKRKSKT